MNDIYEIEAHDGYEMITCAKRKLQIQVIHTDHIPENMPEHAHIAFATLFPGIKALGQVLEQEILTAFCILEPDQIEFEPYFVHPVLIMNAIHDYFGRIFKCAFDKIEYSPAYQRRCIDTMSLEPDKMSLELRGYMSRDLSEEPLDFFEWKQKHLQPILN
jgi:hypothetical protein